MTADKTHSAPTELARVVDAAREYVECKRHCRRHFSALRDAIAEMERAVPDQPVSGVESVAGYCHDAGTAPVDRRGIRAIEAVLNDAKAKIARGRTTDLEQIQAQLDQGYRDLHGLMLAIARRDEENPVHV